MPFCAKYSLYRYACRDFCRPPSNTVGSIFSPNSMICVETLTNITILQEVSWLCQSAFAGETPCDWLFLSLLITYVSTANKDRYFRILTLSPFSRKRLVGVFLVASLLTMWPRNNFASKQKSGFFNIIMSLKPGCYFSHFMSLPLFKGNLN